MKHLMSLILLLALFSLAFGQHSRTTISNDFKISEKDYQGQIVAHSIYHNNFFYTATNSGIGGNYKWLFTKLYDMKYTVTVSRYDKNMNKNKEYKIGNGAREFGPLMPELLLINDKLALAYFQPDENKTSFTLYLALVDEDNLTLKAPQKLCTIQQPNVGIMKLEGIITGKLVSFAYSPDKTKALVVCVTGTGMLKTYVIDNELRILKQSDLRTPTEGFTVCAAVLTNDNNECIVLKSEEGTKVVANSADKKKLEIKLNAAGGLKPYLTSAAVSNDGKTIYLCSSGTDVSSENNSSTGLLLYQLDCGTMHLSKPLTYAFTPEQLKTFCENGGGSRHRREYSMFNFTPAITELDNGTLAILGCPENVSASGYTSAPNMQHKTHEVAITTVETGPVIAFYPDKGGKKFEYAVIPRRISISRSAQSGSGTIQIVQSPKIAQAYSGFIAANLGNEIMIIYNDAAENINKNLDAKVVETDSPKDLVLAEAVFGADRKLEYRKQIDDASGKNTFFLGDLVPTSTDTIVFPIGKQGMGFNERKTFYTNWCFLEY